MAKRKIKKKAVKKVQSKVREDKFLDEDSAVVVDHAYVSHPGDDVVRSVVNDLDGFRDWERSSRGNGLTFGDY